jgi:DNA sulfur modification protein DndE
MGTDIGLRFKTTRGRGGVVENIYCSDISMTNILGEAILFDMYYNGKDFAESESNPKIETKPVSEETPVFKNFLIQNISCIGASRGIVIRGLPEMNVQNIAIENSAIEAKKGIYCIEGDNIRFKNIRFSVTEDATLAMISNSKNLIFDKIEFSNNIKTILNVNGVKSDNLRLLNTATGQNVFGEGVNKKAIKVQ